MKTEVYLHIIFGLFAVFIWVFPENSDIKIKLLISCIIVLSVGLVIFKEKLYIFRKYWQEMTSAALLASMILFFIASFAELLVPAIFIVLAAVSIALLLSLKYTQGRVYRTKVLLKAIPINAQWLLNHWGSNCASISDNKMVFAGTSAPQGTDGSHIDFKHLLEVGKSYEVSCLAKADPNTTGMFQLWCHDQTGEQPSGATAATPYKTPSSRGERVSLVFAASYNPNIRVHLQYTPGQGRIEISDVKIERLNT